MAVTNTKKPKMTPKDFFLYLASAVTLYVSAGSLIALLFEIVDAMFPDRLDVAINFGSNEGLRLAIASLIIIFPLYLLLTFLVRADVVKDTLKYDLSIRKWFIFFTLFLAGGVVVGDLVALVNTFLNGEITARFILKVASVLLVAGAVFLYYFYDLRRAKKKDTAVQTSLIWISALAVLAAVVGGFLIMGSPAEQRDLRFDRERVEGLQLIQDQIVRFWDGKGALPEDLSEMEDDIIGFRTPVDPETDEPYGYSITGELSFVLCATFSQKSPEANTPRGAFKRPFHEAFNWEHDVGRVCFDREIDPDLVDVDTFPPLRVPALR